MPLTNQQREAVRVLDWFYSDHDIQRRSGRTYAQAIALIRLAASNPGRRVYCAVDHASVVGVGIRNLADYMMDVVRSLIREDHLLIAFFTSWRDSFAFDPRMRPIVDWWPQDEVPLPINLQERRLLLQPNRFSSREAARIDAAFDRAIESVSDTAALDAYQDRMLNAAFDRVEEELAALEEMPRDQYPTFWEHLEISD